MFKIEGNDQPSEFEKELGQLVKKHSIQNFAAVFCKNDGHPFKDGFNTSSSEGLEDQKAILMLLTFAFALKDEVHEGWRDRCPWVGNLLEGLDPNQPLT